MIKHHLSKVWQFQRVDQTYFVIEEAEERTEWIALSAQTVAMTKEHANMEAELKESNEALKRKLVELQQGEHERCTEKEKELSDARSTVAGLEFEVESLREALQEKDSSLETNNSEEINIVVGDST